MKKTILYTLSIIAAIAIAVITVFVGCDGDLGERSDAMDTYLDKFHYNKKIVKKFTVTYDGNEATDGEAPIDEKSPYDSGKIVIIVTGRGTLTKDGLNFLNWNTKANGSGDDYGEKAWFTITQNVTLYAQWGIPTKRYEVTVTSSIATTGSSGSLTYIPGETVRINAGTPPAGWQFQNWTTDSRGVTLDDSTSASTTFIMPENKVNLMAMFVFKTGGEVSAFTDERDRKTYLMVTIGQKTWMAQNLNYLNDMTEGDSSWCYDDDPDNCNKYGRLYTWDAAMKNCPTGWRLPDTADWNSLVNAIGANVASEKLKSKSGWNMHYEFTDANSNGTDVYGFSALPAGSRNSAGGFDFVGDGGRWWTVAENDGDAYYRFIDWSSRTKVNQFGIGYVNGIYYGKSSGFSVRCIKND